MIFVDSSAIFAITNDKDIYHNRAIDLFAAAERTGDSLLVHNYLLVEASALLQRRFGFATAVVFLRDALTSFEVHWISPEEHHEAVDYLIQTGRTRLSLVDSASFVVMRKLGVAQYLGFDRDFDQEGFRQFRG